MRITDIFEYNGNNIDQNKNKDKDQVQDKVQGKVTRVAGSHVEIKDPKNPGVTTKVDLKKMDVDNTEPNKPKLKPKKKTAAGAGHKIRPGQTISVGDDMTEGTFGRPDIRKTEIELDENSAILFGDDVAVYNDFAKKMQFISKNQNNSLSFYSKYIKEKHLDYFVETGTVDIILQKRDLISGYYGIRVVSSRGRITNYILVSKYAKKEDVHRDMRDYFIFVDLLDVAQSKNLVGEGTFGRPNMDNASRKAKNNARANAELNPDSRTNSNPKTRTGSKSKTQLKTNAQLRSNAEGWAAVMFKDNLSKYNDFAKKMKLIDRIKTNDLHHYSKWIEQEHVDYLNAYNVVDIILPQREIVPGFYGIRIVKTKKELLNYIMLSEHTKRIHGDLPPEWLDYLLYIDTSNLAQNKHTVYSTRDNDTSYMSDKNYMALKIGQNESYNNLKNKGVNEMRDINQIMAERHSRRINEMGFGRPKTQTDNFKRSNAEGMAGVLFKHQLSKYNDFARKIKHVDRNKYSNLHHYSKWITEEHVDHFELYGSVDIIIPQKETVAGYYGIRVLLDAENKIQNYILMSKFARSFEVADSIAPWILKVDPSEISHNTNKQYFTRDNDTSYMNNAQYGSRSQRSDDETNESINESSEVNMNSNLSELCQNLKRTTELINSRLVEIGTFPNYRAHLEDINSMGTYMTDVIGTANKITSLIVPRMEDLNAGNSNVGESIEYEEDIIDFINEINEMAYIKYGDYLIDQDSIDYLINETNATASEIVLMLLENVK